MYPLKHSTSSGLPIYPIQRKYGEPVSSNINLLGECLALFVFFDYEQYIWVMEEYGNAESWTRRYKIDIPCDKFVYLEKNDELLLMEDYRGMHIRCDVWKIGYI